nr:MAG TPA: hypothetical protein [Caudoviricetes sp.]
MIANFENNNTNNDNNMITKDTCRTLEDLLAALPSPAVRRRATVWYQSALSAAATIHRECPYLAVLVAIEDKRPVCHINVLRLKPLSGKSPKDDKTVTETVGYLQLDLICRFQVTDRKLDDDENPEDQYNQAEELLDFTTDIINTYA